MALVLARPKTFIERLVVIATVCVTCMRSRAQFSWLSKIVACLASRNNAIIWCLDLNPCMNEIPDIQVPTFYTCNFNSDPESILWVAKCFSSVQHLKVALTVLSKMPAKYSCFFLLFFILRLFKEWLFAFLWLPRLSGISLVVCHLYISMKLKFYVISCCSVQKSVIYLSIYVHIHVFFINL